jgi:hypothetical protein
MASTLLNPDGIVGILVSIRDFSGGAGSPVF